MDIDLLRTDPEKEDLGTWVDYTGNSKIKVARYNNPLAQNLRAELARENAKILQGAQDKSPEEQKEALDKWFEIETETLVRHVIKDWEGFTQGEEELPFSEEVAREILSDKRYREFRADLMTLCTNRDNFREEADREIEDAVKTDAAS